MRRITAILVAIILSNTMQVWSEQGHSDQTSSTTVEKFYIPPNHLQFNNTDMYAYLNDNWVHVYAVYSDDRGLFVECKQPNPECSRCPECRTYHSDSVPCPYKKQEREDRREKKDKEDKKEKRDKEEKKYKKYR